MDRKSSSTSNKKRTLAEVSPTNPISKRKNTPTNMTSKVADMSVEQLQALLAPLATKEDLAALQFQVSSLKKENKALSVKVDQLSEKCTNLENQMESIYMWKNNNNLIVTMNKTDLENAKNRVQSVYSNIAKEEVTIDNKLIRELRSSNNQKIILKVTVSDSQLISKIIPNTSLLKGSDISISKG